jgi:agmatine deiminase
VVEGSFERRRAGEGTWRQPAEWEPHDACWLAWPSAADLWQDNLPSAQTAFVGLAAAIADTDPATARARGETVHVLVPDEAREAEARGALAGVDARFHRVPFGDIWLRDTAPIFVVSDSNPTHPAAGRVAASVFGFNGWGGKYVLPGDDAVAGRVAEISGLSARRFRWVLEGGSVEVDGEGTCLTTRQCLLNPNRNQPGETRLPDPVEIEQRLAEALGVDKVLWLSRGLANDHTDGHIDTLVRFVAPGVVVCMEAREAGDPNAEVLRALLHELEGMVDAKGRALRAVRIPSPGRIVSAGGDVMPASYANYYVGNRTVVVPTYGSRWDEEAVSAIGSLFPGRRTSGIDARAILTGGGAFHCITQQQPTGVRV